MTVGVITQFSIAAVVLVALGGATFTLGWMMRRKRAWSRNIVAHICRVGGLTLIVLTLRQTVFLALSLYPSLHVGPETINIIAALAIALLWLRELLQLINRLTSAQISKGSDPTSARAVARALKVAAACLVLLLFGEHFGIGLSGLLAFGGIGGIAIGMASKDVLSNIFSGIMLFFDRPFRIGDWVSSPDRNIEGTVVEIGWRITKIITFDHRPLYVPNAVFSAISVENPGQMTNRRIKTTIGLRYEDAQRVQPVVNDIRAMLQGNDKIDHDHTLLVYFDEFAGSSLNIMVYCFTKTTDWAAWLAAQQEVYLAIIDIVHRHGADFAFQSQTLYIAEDQGGSRFNLTRSSPPQDK